MWLGEFRIPGGRFQYTGQGWLPELGMYHYKNRIYSPTLGRFLQTDPIDVAGGINLYAYVTNDPVNLVDPLGLDGGTITVTGRRDILMIEMKGYRYTASPRSADPDEATNDGPDITVRGKKPKRASGAWPKPPPSITPIVQEPCRVPLACPVPPAPLPRPQDPTQEQECGEQCQRQRELLKCVAIGVGNPSYDLQSDARRSATQQRYTYEFTSRAVASLLLFDIGKAAGQCAVNGSVGH